MMLNFEVFSVGKTDRRNDDMAFAVPLFRHQVLGLLGDFTSDSPAGVNVACRSHLETFIADKLATWREMLLPPERLLPLLLRKTNDWLADFDQKAQTTLIVFCWDLRAETCHFISVGDSGLAAVGASGVRYLREGDRDGLRISAGFLPGPVDATVMVAPVRRDETVFAFSDGLWENTTTFMSDALLQEVFGPPALAEVARRIQTRILEPAIRKDDLSILVMKGDTMEGQGSHPIDSEQLERLIAKAIERQADALIGSGRAGEPSPVERDLLRWLDDAPRLQRQLADALGEQLGRSIEGLVKRQLDEQRDMFQRQLSEQQRRLESQLSAQSEQIKSLEQALAKGGAPRDEARPTSRGAEPQATSRRASQSNKASRPTPAEPVVKSDKVYTASAKGDGMRDLLQNRWLSFGIIGVLVICVGLFVKFAFFPGKAKPTGEVAQTAQPENGQTGMPPIAELEPEPPVISYTPAPVPDGLLALMNIDRNTYAQQTGAIFQALGTLTAPPTGPLNLVDSPGLDKLAVAANFNWQQKPAAGTVSKLWLQAHAGAQVDGDPGAGTRKKFEAKFAPRLEALKQLVKALDQPVVAELDKQVCETYQLSRDAYIRELQELANKMRVKGADVAKLKVAWYRDKRYLATTVMLDGTPIRAWLDQANAKAKIDTGDLGIELRAVWLAAQVGLAESDGASSETLKRAIAPPKTCAELLTEGLNQWK